MKLKNIISEAPTHPASERIESIKKALKDSKFPGSLYKEPSLPRTVDAEIQVQLRVHSMFHINDLVVLERLSAHRLLIKPMAKDLLYVEFELIRK